MSRPEAIDTDSEVAVKERILRMPVAQLYGFRFGALACGEAEIIQSYREELSHGGGFFQGSVIGVVADFAAGAAAATVLPAGWTNATVDYTVKIVAPAKGDHLVARGRVVRPGRTLTVAGVEVYVAKDGQESLCATALATFRNLRPPTSRGGSQRAEPVSAT